MENLENNNDYHINKKKYYSKGGKMSFPIHPIEIKEQSFEWRNPGKKLYLK